MVSIYIKLVQIEDRIVAPLCHVGEIDFVNYTNFCILTLPLTSLTFLTQCPNRNPPLLGFLIIDVSLFCISSYLVKL